MISHTTLHVSDIDKAKEFYKKALAPLGYVADKEYAEYKVVGFKSGEGNHDFWLHGNECKQTTHLAFTAPTQKAVDEFYKAAIAAGAKDNGAPGPRPDYGPNYYAAFFLDADGNNIEAAYFGEQS
jgi:catechol 2,3-dioxygenase-like lactoylglutathione lyase family enzyme